MGQAGLGHLSLSLRAVWLWARASVALGLSFPQVGGFVCRPSVRSGKPGLARRTQSPWGRTRPPLPLHPKHLCSIALVRSVLSITSFKKKKEEEKEGKGTCPLRKQQSRKFPTALLGPRLVPAGCGGTEG